MNPNAAIFGQFGDNFEDNSGTNLGQIWDNFGTILGQILGTILGQFWDKFGTILGQFWDNFGRKFWGNFRVLAFSFPLLRSHTPYVHLLRISLLFT